MARLKPPKQPQLVRPGTLIETDEDIRRAELANKAAIPLATPIAKKADALPTAKPAAAQPYQPTLRPSICVFTVFGPDQPRYNSIVLRMDDLAFAANLLANMAEYSILMRTISSK